MDVKVPLPVLLALLVIMIGAVAGAFIYGVTVPKTGPVANLVFELKEALQQTEDALRGNNPYGYIDSNQERVVTVRDEQAMQPGLTLIAAIDKDFNAMVRVVSSTGDVVQEWVVDWYELWPDPNHIQKVKQPKKKPAAFVHGAQILADHSLMFNFEYLGMMRLDACSNVMWRLPYITHHSLMPDGQGNFWAGGRNWIPEEDAKRYPHLRTPRLIDTLVRVSPEGEILETISMPDILSENDLMGFLFMSTTRNFDTSVNEGVDVLHLNDAEVFPEDMEPGLFEPGDIMLSLRNINTIIVIEPDTRRIKYLRTGGFVRQHDPDFVDGNTISIYDNNHSAPEDVEISSRIVTLDARTDEITVRYPTETDPAFYSNVLGNHQLLPNGNILITASFEGRALEIDSSNKPVWEYFNIVESGETLGVIIEASRLPVELTAESFASARQACGTP